MFLHIGDDIMVPLREMIGIIDLTDSASPVNAEFLKTAEEEGFVVQLTEKPASLVVCTKQVYLSLISAQTLQKRARRSFAETD